MQLPALPLPVLPTLSPPVGLTPLDLLFAAAAATLLLALLLGRWRIAGPLLVIGYAMQFWLLLQTGTLHGAPMTAATSFEILGHALTWRYDALSWFFAMITIGAGFVTAWYAGGGWQGLYRSEGHSPRLFHVALAANVFSMLLLVGSGDFLSLFIGWELVSWASFFLMAIAGGVAARAALRYVTYAFAGAMAVLGALVLIYSVTGSFSYADFVAAVPGMTNGQLWVLVALLVGGFGVKLGLIPFHLWQAPAYAETPGPGSAFFGAISARMGLYAITVVFVAMVGIGRLVQMEIPYTFISARELLCWIAALTIIFPTYTALQQHDARYLLAWHGIGQGGYMLLGLLVGTANGSAGGLLHVFNYAITQAALLMTVFAVMYRTGTADLNKMGGLFTRMPISFAVLLIGIISLAGLPPMAGFVSKWMVYRALIAQQMPFLFVAAVIGTLGTILSVYKLIHNMFLGQLRVEHQDVREAPVSMLAPMLGLSTVIFLAGVFPGPALSWVAEVQRALDLDVVHYTLGGIQSPQGSIDMVWLVGVLFGGFGVGALVFYGLGGKSRQVHQLDNYAGGHFLTADVRYHYSDNFYAGLMHLIGGWYKGGFRWLEGTIASSVELLSFATGGVYRYVQPTLYVLVVAVVMLAWVML
ncbi:MAG: NADH dehydrogenase subunit [Thiohalocapsa sp.]|jgi:NADH-quinone oxidoreductase subunit M|uniref:proton-conducting transporter transmembrane domain-containing protein n=1 Tax=Thiohalocapsa sp. TaxID=2497641 RepID=UPI0025E9B29E|nr:proton-conducting transporter membrane subunit [Thiohalocapsa sp.]MCG6940524.1 NADH dehydrogenase subunit [Thiohalocapsa sp.]